MIEDYFQASARPFAQNSRVDNVAPWNALFSISILANNVDFLNI